jgi:hypothetical protein
LPITTLRVLDGVRRANEVGYLDRRGREGY